jgi:hypothetical protein
MKNYIFLSSFLSLPHSRTKTEPARTRTQKWRRGLDEDHKRPVAEGRAELVGGKKLRGWVCGKVTDVVTFFHSFHRADFKLVAAEDGNNGAGRVDA